MMIDTKDFAPYMKDKKTLYKILAIDGNTFIQSNTLHNRSNVLATIR